MSTIFSAIVGKPAERLLTISNTDSRPETAVKNLRSIFATALIVIFAIAVPGPASAAPVFWTDWQTSPDIFSASGELMVGLSTVDVDYSGTGSHSFVTTGGGTNYWAPSAPYLSATVDNAPPASDIVALNIGGTVTITFSQAVTDPFIGLVSWNGNTVDFGVPIEIISFGPGFWGNGTPILNPGGTGFFGSGEVHGVIRLPGTHSSISFSHTSEGWHGFTVGVAGIAVSAPEPASIALFAAGLLGLGFRRRYRQPSV